MRRIAPLAVLALLCAVASAQAGYPPPGKPGPVKRHKGGKHQTFRVCKHGKHRYRTISRAIRKAEAGDTVRVCHGVYREGVQIAASKPRLKLIGDVRHPSRVVIESKGLKGAAAQNSLFINGADHVTVEGFYARHYKGNGFFALNVRGYRLAHLLAGHGGTYGVYAFNSKGGTITRSEAFYNNDSGFYVGQTPRQVHKLRTRVSHVKAWGNVIGFSGTNMRYVRITKSKWWNNGLGIVPNALTSEKFAPPEENVITDNDVFWNNYNYFAGAPFHLKAGATGDLSYPVGIGILLFGGRHNIVTGNRVYGNWLAGAGAFEQVLFLGDSNPKVRRDGVLVGNEIRGNDFGLGGEDLNGRDLSYDGEGRDNCLSDNTTLSPTVPADGNTYEPCPFSGANTMDPAAQAEGLGWSLDPTHEGKWLRHPHKAQKGLRPLVHCAVVKSGCQGQPRR